MQRVVIVYDITDNKTRRIVGEILEGFGRRVNRSVFECAFRTRTQRRKLEAALLHEIDPAIDSVRIYTMCADGIASSSVLGDEPDPFDEKAVYFF